MGKLKTMALDQSIILAGIVEGISTGIISDCLKNLLPEKFSPASDWEVLFVIGGWRNTGSCPGPI